MPRSMMPEIRLLLRGVRHRRELVGSCARRRSPASWATSRPRRSDQAAFQTGESKNTYGTGCFLIFNTGERSSTLEERAADHCRVQARRRTDPLRAGGFHRCHADRSSSGCATSSASSPRPPRSRSWPSRSRTTAACTSSRPSQVCSHRTGARDARGVIVGLTRYANKNHIARAALEAVAFQTRDVLDAVNRRRRSGPDRAQGRWRHWSPTMRSCSSRPMCSACRWCARSSQRRRHSAQRTQPPRRRILERLG